MWSLPVFSIYSMFLLFSFVTRIEPTTWQFRCIFVTCVFSFFLSQAKKAKDRVFGSTIPIDLASWSKNAALRLTENQCKIIRTYHCILRHKNHGLCDESTSSTADQFDFLLLTSTYDEERLMKPWLKKKIMFILSFYNQIMLWTLS